MTATDLLHRLLDHDPPAELVEQFVAERLAAAGEWETPRTSDGVSFHRVVERGPGRVTIAGQIWSIDQQQHAFWLTVDGERWSLRLVSDPRRVRDAPYQDSPDGVAWRLELGGTA